MWTSRYVARSSGADALYPVFVHRLARLFHASFRPRLAAIALASSLGLTSIRLTRGLSPPSCEHAQHTTKPLARRTLPRMANPALLGVADVVWGTGKRDS